MFNHCFFEIILVSSVNVMSFLAFDYQFKIVSIKTCHLKLCVCVCVCVCVCAYYTYICLCFLT
jgi:hypothetical protein